MNELVKITFQDSWGDQFWQTSAGVAPGIGEKVFVPHPACAQHGPIQVIDVLHKYANSVMVERELNVIVTLAGKAGI